VSIIACDHTYQISIIMHQQVSSVPYH